MKPIRLLLTAVAALFVCSCPPSTLPDPTRTYGPGPSIPGVIIGAEAATNGSSSS